MLRTAAVVVFVAMLMGGAALLASVRERQYPMPTVSEESLYLTSGTTLRRLTAGYNALAADLYWIRAVQYYGGTKLETEHGSPSGAAPDGGHFALLYPLLDLTTTLDPEFNIAYRFGAIFLAEAYPAGAGRPDLAIALLEKGLRVRPDKWEYMQDIGFVHYWWDHDYATAAKWFERASNVPGAPWFLRSLAATTLAQGGDRQASRTVWQAILESADNDWLRQDAERRLLQLQAMDEIDRLQQLVDRVTAATGRVPADWSAVLGKGRVPVDPTHTALYELDEGRVTLSRKSPIFPLPAEPETLPVP
jgi:tetratricopeptide (TPR) repeat protein